MGSEGSESCGNLNRGENLMIELKNDKKSYNGKVVFEDVNLKLIESVMRLSL